MSSDVMVGGKLLSSLRVVDLKEELEKRGLSKSGTKKDLAERLKNFIVQEQKQNQAKEAEEAIAAEDQEQLPNISMQEKLAEQNPFIRDYFASQAQLFHSQKVAKQRLEEEARRESEASQDEGEESSAPEDKDLNSSTEDNDTGKVRRLGRRFENKNNSTKETTKAPSQSPPKRESPRKAVAEPPAPVVVEVAPPPPKVATPPPPAVEIAEKSPVKTTKEKQLEKLAGRKVELTTTVQKSPSPQRQLQPIVQKSPAKPTEVEKMPVKDATKEPPAEEEENGSESSGSRSRSSSRSRSPSPAPPAPAVTKAVKSTPVKDSNHKEEADKADHDTSSSGEDELREAQPEIKSKEINNGTVKRVTELRENKSQEKEEEPAAEIILAPEEESIKEPEVSGESRSPSRSRSPSPIRLPEESKPEIKSTKESIIKQQDEKEKLETKSPVKNSREIVFNTDEVKEKEKFELKSPVKSSREIVFKTDEIKEKAPAPVKEEIKLSTLRSHRLPSAARQEEDEEEALDYGDEEKMLSEPPKFNWTQRILQFKGKHSTKARSTNKWKRDPENNDNINSESMLQWFTEIKLIPASDLRLEEKERSPREEDHQVEFHRKFSIESDDNEMGPMENITITRKVNLVPLMSQEGDEDKDLSPSRNPPSELILVTNLVRPFTLPQLRELLQRTGNLEELWVDKIKSKCIAKYEKEEEAFETRAALHGIPWPSSNPKALHVDYTTQERLDDFKAKDAGIIKPVSTEQPIMAENLPVREWDVGKRAKSRSPKRRRSRSTSRDRKRPRRSQSPNRRRHSRSPQDRRSKGDAKEPEPLGKALDELFRKTTATPSIYWLPLTPHQIAEKEEMRRKRMVERERRLSEISKVDKFRPR